MSLMSTPCKNIVTGNQPVSGDKAKIFSYGNSVPDMGTPAKPVPPLIEGPTNLGKDVRGE